jgi:hypothetical protein
MMQSPHLSASSSSQAFTKERLESILRKITSTLLSSSTATNIQVNVRYTNELESGCHIVEVTNIHSSSVVELISAVKRLLYPGPIHLDSDDQDGTNLTFFHQLIVGQGSLSLGRILTPFPYIKMEVTP